MAEWPGLPAGYDLPLVNSSTKRLPDPTMDAIEEALIPAFGPDAISNPETAMNGAVVEVVEGVLGGGASGLPMYFNGALENSAVARPAWGGVVVWRIFEGDPVPTNIASQDVIEEVEVEPLPDVLVWADDFNRSNGALVNTGTGGLPYFVAGGAGDSVYSVVSNQAALTAGTGSASYCGVNSGYSRGVLQVTVPTQADGYGGVFFRYVDTSNNFVLGRVSGSDFSYRLVKRVSNTATTVKVFTGVTMSSGDVIRVDDRVLGKLKIYINDVLRYDEEVDTTEPVNVLTTATRQGMYLGSSNVSGTTADNVRFDDISFYRVA